MSSGSVILTRDPHVGSIDARFAFIDALGEGLLRSYTSNHSSSGNTSCLIDETSSNAFHNLIMEPLFRGSSKLYAEFFGLIRTLHLPDLVNPERRYVGYQLDDCHVLLDHRPMNTCSIDITNRDELKRFEAIDKIGRYLTEYHSERDN